jgi:hypothetical protein
MAEIVEDFNGAKMAFTILANVAFKLAYGCIDRWSESVWLTRVGQIHRLQFQEHEAPLGWTNELHVDLSKSFPWNDIYKEGLTCVDGFAQRPSTARRPRDAVF